MAWLPQPLRAFAHNMASTGLLSWRMADFETLHVADGWMKLYWCRPPRPSEPHQSAPVPHQPCLLQHGYGPPAAQPMPLIEPH